MSINHALYSGVSGLSTNSDGMSVIANNIANANTKSFKADRAEFEDLLSVNLSEMSQLGRGSRLRNTTTLYNQGALTNTGGITDLGIQGDGFFLVKNDQAEIKESNGMFFTRQGSFRFDRDGKLTDPMGGRLQGYMAEQGGKLSTRLTDLEIMNNNIAPMATTVVNVIANLDVREKPPVDDFDMARASETSNFETSVTLYDDYGNGRQATIYFVRDNDMSQNTWSWYAAMDGIEFSNKPELDAKGKPLPVQVAQGNIEFDNEGKPLLKYTSKLGEKTYVDTVDKGDAFELQFPNGARPQKIQFNFGPSIEEDNHVGVQGSTSVAAKSGVNFHSQNGYEAGYLKSLKIDLDGNIRGVYTNGLERRLAAIALATFPNNTGLQKAGRNNFLATPKAGTPRIGLAQTSSRGSVYSASLEESNVDLAQQFVDMITTQRGFQANSKSITTTDTMLEEIINLKR